jgi:hypothetical protein
LERHWTSVRDADRVYKTRYEGGAIGEESYLEARCFHLDALIGLAKFKSESPTLFALDSVHPPETFEDEVDPFYLKDFAKAKFEATYASLRDLNRAKVEAARGAWQGRERQLLERVDLSSMIEASLRLLAAKRDETDNQAIKLEAIEGHWTRMKLCETAAEDLFRREPAWAAAYFQTSYFRFDAEGQLARVRAKIGR